MPASPLKSKDRSLRLFKCTQNPDLDTRTILVEDQWDYVEMWLKRNHAPLNPLAALNVGRYFEGLAYRALVHNSVSPVARHAGWAETSWGHGMRDRLRDYGAEVEESGQAFTLGDLRVFLDLGYSDGGDWLRFMVIRALPLTSTAAERLSDPRYDVNSGRLPLLWHPDGAMRPVKTDGRAYLFVGDELRSVRVEMNEHTDPNGLSRTSGLEGMWEYLQRFRVAGE